MNCAIARIFLIFFFCIGVYVTAAQVETHAITPVIIDYFFETGCSDCNRVSDEIMPELEERFGGFYVVNRHDVGIKSNVVKLVTYQEKLGIVENEPVCMVVDYRYVLNGFAAIKKGLFDRINECVAARLEPGWTPAPPVRVPQTGNDMGIVEGRAKSFTLPAIMAAGLIDGINPCAISTLVFFMSLLAVSKVSGGGLALMGASFCLASFATYTALGFGLLRALHLLAGFPVARIAVETAMIIALCIFAYLSFRDAWRYKASGDANQMALQLPHKVKMKIHKKMRSGLGIGSLALGGLFMGAVVTALESVCTGQVYVPTLVLMIKSGKVVSRAWFYLLLYNAMFVVPLIFVFVLTCFGLRMETLVKWSKKNVVISKLLLGCFFAVMAALIGAM